MRWRPVLGVVLLVAAGTSSGCPRREDPEGAVPEVIAAPATTPSPTPAPVPSKLTMVLEGLVKVTHDSGRKVLWGLMVDATKDTITEPPCAAAYAAHYEPHRPAIFVHGARLFGPTGEVKPALIDVIDHHEITVATGKTTFEAADGTPIDFTKALASLVDADALDDGLGDPTAALDVEPRYYDDAVIDPKGPNTPTIPNLIARLRIAGADTVEVGTSVCEKEQGLMEKYFGFETDVSDVDGKCNAAAPKDIQLGEDVVLTQAKTETVTLTIANDQETRRYYVIPDGTPFHIAFRNTMPGYHRQDPTKCPVGADEHYFAYRWYYLLEKDNGEPERCKVAPCRDCYSPKKCEAAGFKCPIP